MTNDPKPTAAAPEAHSTVPWPVVDSYSGGADPAGLHSRVRLRFGDGPETVEYVPAAAAPDVLALSAKLIDSALDSDASGRPAGSLADDAMRLGAALSAQGEAKPEPRAADEFPLLSLHDERLLRRLLCKVYAGPLAYMDDGEAQDSRAAPMIDFLRDTPASIQEKMRQRVLAAVATPEPQEGRKPAEWNVETDDFEVHMTMADGEDVMIAAKTSGPRDAALAEALNYARQYEDEGPVQVFEVRRTPIGGITQDGERDHG